MPIEFPCPQCNQLLRTPDDTAGRKAKCPQCASIVDIPVAPQSEGAGFNPFAGKLEMAGGDSGNVEVDTNPYAAPQEAASRPDFGVAAPGDEELVPTRVTTGEILSRTWTRFTNNLVPCLLFGLIAIGIQMAAQVVGIPLQILQTAFQGEPAVVVGCVVAQQVWGILVQAITMCIAILFAMNFLRGHPEPLKGIFNIGPFFPRVFLTQIVIMLAVLGVLVVCALPAGIASLMKQDMTLLIILGVIGGLIGLPILVYLFMRLFVAQFLIVDRRQGIFESLANSGIFMRGNKLAVFSAVLVVGVLGTLFTIVTCCIGTIFATPFFWLAAAVIYTSVTGQWREAENLPHDSAATT